MPFSKEINLGPFSVSIELYKYNKSLRVENVYGACIRFTTLYGLEFDLDINQYSFNFEIYPNDNGK